VISDHYGLLSDERLAVLAGEGNDAAFDALYRRYDCLLDRYCRSITRHADDAGDALQNAWMKVHRALRRRQRNAPVRPWLFRVVHNEAVGVLRARPASAQPLDDETATVASVDEQAASRERVAEAVADLRGLPNNQRDALVMRELADCDYDEIAVGLDTTETNARQLVFAAKASLEDSLAGRELPCRTIRRFLVRADGRQLRRRRFRAHLRSCRACRDFAAQVRQQRR
jgi:RNA polymerase sigma factor (sigma-70 family)